MKKKELTELRVKEAKELKKLAEDRQAEIKRINPELGIGKEKNLKKVKNLRREIAQVLTIIKEMEIIQRKETK